LSAKKCFAVTACKESGGTFKELEGSSEAMYQCECPESKPFNNTTGKCEESAES
jgi:hypothetical protein